MSSTLAWLHCKLRVRVCLICDTSLGVKPGSNRRSHHSRLSPWWNSDNCQTMLAAYPFIASLLARIAVLPALSAEVERVFSDVKCIKTLVRNRLCTRILDSLVRVTMGGPNTPSWDPLLATLKWELTGILSCCRPHLHQPLIHLLTEYYVLHVTQCWYCSSCTLRQ